MCLIIMFTNTGSQCALMRLFWTQVRLFFFYIEKPLKAVASNLHHWLFSARDQDVTIGTPVSFLTWLTHEVRGRPLGLRQPTGTRRFMEMPRFNPSIALHGTVDDSVAEGCLLVWMRFPMCGSPKGYSFG